MHPEIYHWALHVSVLMNVHLIAVKVANAYASRTLTVVRGGNVTEEISFQTTVSSLPLPVPLSALRARRTRNVRQVSAKVISASAMLIPTALQIKNASSTFSALTTARDPYRLRPRAKELSVCVKSLQMGEVCLQG